MKTITTLFLIMLLSTLYAQKEGAIPISKGEKSIADPAATFRGSINKARSNIKSLSIWIEEWEAQLNTEAAPVAPGTTRTSNLNMSKSNIDRQTRSTPINTSRSNIKNISIALDNLENSDPTKGSAPLQEVYNALNDLDVSVQELYDSILSKGEAYAAKAAELKTRHDTVKNSIGNIR